MQVSIHDLAIEFSVRPQIIKAVANEFEVEVENGHIDREEFVNMLDLKRHRDRTIKRVLSCVGQNAAAASRLTNMSDSAIRHYR